MNFILSKIIWVIISPSNALLLLLLLGAFLSVAQRENWRRFGRRLCFTVALLFFLIAVFPVSDWLLIPLENRHPAVRPDRVDGILLLGEDEKPRISHARGQPVTYLSGQNYVTFAALAREYPKAHLVFAGGSGLLAPDPNIKDAEVARRALAGMGVPVDRMVFEDQSRNTYENAVKAAALVHPTPQQTWLLVASARHMPRSLGCFRKAGWNIFPATTGYLTDGVFSARLTFNLGEHLYYANRAVHEYVGLLAYRLMGYTDKLWP